MIFTGKIGNVVAPKYTYACIFNHKLGGVLPGFRIYCRSAFNAGNFNVNMKWLNKINT